VARSQENGITILLGLKDYRLGEVVGVLSISEMGHFLNRTLWHNQVALASSLRSRL